MTGNEMDVNFHREGPQCGDWPGAIACFKDPQKVLSRNGNPEISSIDMREKLESYWNMLNDLHG